ncbi:21739_t:CDS:1, partial [Racocetra persica]
MKIKELYLSKEDCSPNEESDVFNENIFFKKNHIPEKNIPLGEDDELEKQKFYNSTILLVILLK